MVKTNKPNSSSSSSSSSPPTKKSKTSTSSLSPSRGGVGITSSGVVGGTASSSSTATKTTTTTTAKSNVAIASSSSSSITTKTTTTDNHQKHTTTSTTTTNHTTIDPTISHLHRAWRQFVSSFLVAARTQPSNDTNNKILKDTIDTNIKARNELRRLLTTIEEHILGRSAKRQDLLEEILQCTPCAVIKPNANKKRKLNDSTIETGVGAADNTTQKQQQADVIDVDAGDLDSFPII